MNCTLYNHGIKKDNFKERNTSLREKNFDTYDDSPMIPVIYESVLMNSNIGFIQVGVCAQSPTLESWVIHFFAGK